MATTTKVIERQLDAMYAEQFEIGLFKSARPDETLPEPEMYLRHWDHLTIVRAAPWLRFQNRVGRNIFIRPKGEHTLSLVDDLGRDALDKMKRQGFNPCLIVETSPGNFQAWLDHGRVLPKTESTKAARALAKRFGGDPGAADWRHFGRLAGFTNRKERHRQSSGLFPYVRLVEAAPCRVYPARDEFLADVMYMDAKLGETTVPHIYANKGGGAHLTIGDFRGMARYDGDNNRIDLAFAIYALSHGVSEDQVRFVLASRDLSKKGTELRQHQYLDRTIAKANEIASLSRTR